MDDQVEGKIPAVKEALVAIVEGFFEDEDWQELVLGMNEQQRTEIRDRGLDEAIDELFFMRQTGRL